MKLEQVPDLPFFNDVVFDELGEEVINYSTSLQGATELALITAGVDPEEISDE